MSDNELKNAAQCALEFCHTYTGEGANTNRYKAFEALALLTLDDLEKGKSATDCKYTVFQIYEKMTGSSSDLFDPDNIKKKVNKYLKDLSEKLPSHHEMFHELAQTHQLSHIPEYDFTAGRGGGSGHQSTHYLMTIKTQSVYPAFLESRIHENGIKYWLESIDDLPAVIKWLNGFELSGWRLNLWASFLIIIMILLFILILLFTNQISEATHFGSALKLLIVYIVFGWLLYSVIMFIIHSAERRIISIPEIYLPVSKNSAQLEFIATEKIRESTGRPIRKYRIVSYAGKCPICNSRVELENGKHEFQYRLIGRCMEAPDEHIFSFDRMTRTGYPLRKYYR